MRRVVIRAASADIEDLINQDVDIIIARAEDAAAMGASIRAADEAGIPFVTFDRAATTATPAAHVGGDSYAQGVSTAEAFAEMLAAAGVEGKCIELQGSLTDVNAVNRSDAWNAVDAESDVFETVVQVPTEWDATVFLSGTANALQANPDANCIFVASDFAINSVESALEAAGKWAPTGDPTTSGWRRRTCTPRRWKPWKAATSTSPPRTTRSHTRRRPYAS